jgi:hypothetical protein
LINNYRANEKPAQLIAYNVQANSQIWQGALLVSDDATGLIEPATDAAAKTFVGIAFEPINNTGGAAGANSGRVQKTGSFVYSLTGDSPTQAVIGKRAFAIDDNTVALTAHSAHQVYVGDIVSLVGTSMVRVRIDRAAG